MDRAIQASLSTMSEEALKKDKKKEVPAEAMEERFVDDIENFPALGQLATSTTAATTVTSTESGSLANKFAMSHNLSVGRGAMGSVEDFPVLKKSASGNNLGSLNQPVINYQALKPSKPLSKQSAKSSQKTQPQKTKPPSNTFSKSLAFQDPVEDFPELPKGLKSNFSRSAGSWQSIAQPSVTQSAPATSNISVIKDKPTEPPVRRDKIQRVKLDDNDFPSLGGGAASGPSVPSKWFKSAKSNTGTSGKNNMKSFEEPSNGNEINIIDRYSPVNIPDIPDSDKKTKPNKKKKKKEHSNPKEQIKKENTKNSLQGNNSLDDIASLLMNSETKKDSSVKKEEPPQTKVKKESVPVVSTNQGKINKGKEDKIEKKMEALHLEEEVDEEYIEKTDPVKFVIEEEDFPTLGAPKKSTNKPPPGFQPETEKQSFKAPPGLTQQAGKKPPPGFKSQTSVPKTQISSETVSTSSVFSNYEYNQPGGFSERNRELIGVIQSCCEDPQDFTEFKRLSGEFRRSDVGAQIYYESCEEVLGKENFSKVFPELLALLPDIPKQQELLSVYIVKNGVNKEDDGVLRISKKPRSGKGAWTPTLSGFLTCQTCHQVLLRKDYNAHVTIHNLDSDFPSLSGEAPTVNSGFGSYGSWVKAK